MTTTKIKLFNSKVSQLVEVIVPSIEKDFINLSKIITQDKFPYLLNFSDKNIVTLLDFTNVTPYEIWYFDNDSKFYNIGFSLISGKGSFRIQTPARYLLLWNRESLYYKEFGYFQCEGIRVGE